MKSVHLLDRNQLRLLGHPLRQSILSLLCREALSTAELRERMPRSPSNLYYHVDRLQQAGLIRIVRRRRVRGAVEKYYRAIAESFTAPPSLLRTRRERPDSDLTNAVEAMATGVLEQFSESVSRGLIGSDPDQAVPMVTSLTVTTTPARLRQLRLRLERCIRAFEKESATASGDVVEYALFDLFFPIAAADRQADR